LVVRRSNGLDGDSVAAGMRRFLQFARLTPPSASFETYPEIDVVLEETAADVEACKR